MIIALFRRHWAILIVAFLASAHVMLPAIAGHNAAGSAYQGIYNSDNSDWLFYVARTRDVAEGHSGANPYLAEHADEVYPNIAALETALAVVVRAFNIEAVNLQIALDAVTPFVITLLFYSVLYFLSKSRWLSVAIPLFLIYANIWSFDKPVHLQLSLPLLLLFLLGWFHSLSQLDRKESLSRRNIIGCGILLGAIYFAYFIDWTFLYVLLFTAAFISLFFGRRDVAVLSLRIIAVSLPFAIAYVLLISPVFQAPFYGELTARLGVTTSHLPEMIPRTAVALAAAGLLFLFLRKAQTAKTALAQGALALLLANAIYPNHNVITGKSFQNAAHWVFQPIFLLSLAVAFVYPYLRRPPIAASRTVRIFACGVIAVFLVAALRLSRYLPPPVTKAKIESTVAAQRYGPVLRYLQQATPADSVVFTDDKLSYLIPAYTHNYVYYLKFVSNLPASNRELAERYIFARQFDPDFFKDPNLGIRPNHQILWENYFHPENLPFYRWLGIRIEPRYTVEDEQHLAGEVMRDLEASGGVSFERMRKYRLDYIVWDKKLNPRWGVDQIPRIEKLYDVNDIIVYRAPSI